MNVLIACEFSGVVRRAFHERGHFAVSCDLLPAEDGDPWQMHYQGDVRDLLAEPWKMIPGGRGHAGKWDLLIAHPPCQFLTLSGVLWMYKGGKANKRKTNIDEGRARKMRAACVLFNELWRADIPRIAIENPIPHGFAREWLDSEYSQIIQPWQFGHGEIKRTCLWLKNLPQLTPTRIVKGRKARVHREPPSPDRWKERSRTLTGIAAAMADQWGQS